MKKVISKLDGKEYYLTVCNDESNVMFMVLIYISTLERLVRGFSNVDMYISTFYFPQCLTSKGLHKYSIFGIFFAKLYFG